MNLLSIHTLIGLALALFFNSTNQQSRPDVLPESEHRGQTTTEKADFNTYLSPVLSATKTDALVTDVGTVGPSPGDVLEYTVSIFNTGDMTATGVVFNDNLDPRTTLVPGSLMCSPVPFPDTYYVLGNVKISVPANAGFLGNDQNPCNTGGALFVTSIITDNTQGDVTFNPDGSFTFNPAPGFNGTTSFQYIVSNGIMGNLGTVTLIVNGRIWFIDNNQPGGGDGRLGTPFNSIADFNSSTGGGSAGDILFLYRQTAAPYTGAGLALKNNQYLIGQGAAAGIAAIAGFTLPPFSEPLPLTGAARPVIGHSDTAIALASNNQIYGVDVSNTGGTGISGGSVGNLKIRDMNAANNGGPALNLSNGSLDVIIDELNASNTYTGFLIGNTTGSFTADGGTVQNITNRGADIQGATNITLNDMTFTDANTADAGGIGVCDLDNTLACNAALYLRDVTTIALNNLTVDNTAEQGLNGSNIGALTLMGCTFTDNGNDDYEGAVKIRELHGSCFITNCTFSNGAEKLVDIANAATSNPLTLTVTGSTFSDTYDSSFGGDGIFIKTENAVSNTVNIDDCDFLRLKSYGVSMRAAAGTLNANVTDSNFDKDTKKSMSGVEITPLGTASVNINILRNTMSFAGAHAILVDGYGNSSFQARINSNEITGPNTCSDCVFGGSIETTNCICAGSGIAVFAGDDSNGKAELISNTIDGLDYNATGIAIHSVDDADLNTLISTNTINLAGDSKYAIDLASGPADNLETASICAHVINNTTAFSATGPQSYTAHFNVIAFSAGSSINLQGAGNTTAAVWNGNGNTPVSPPAVIDSINTNGGIIALGQTCDYTLTHPLPLLPPVDELAQPGGAPVNSLLSQNNLPQNATANGADLPIVNPDTPPTSTLSMVDLVSVGPLSLPANGAIIIKFRAAINNPVPVGVCQISNQGAVSADGVSTILTDDPDVAGAGDPTVTNLMIPPNITSCQSNIVAYTDPGGCTATVNLNASASGCPAPTITYRIGLTPIPSTYSFPVGITNVTVLVSNGVMPNAFCSFKVTVIDNQGPDVTCLSGTQQRVVNTANCSYIIQGTEFNPVADGNCQGYTLTNNYTGSSTLAGVELPVGTYTIAWTITDNVGLQDVCSVTIQVIDQTLSITCPPPLSTACNILNLPPYSSLSAFITAGGTVSQNCGLNQASFALLSQTGGPVNYVRTYKISDASGQTATCTQNVTVVDNVPPVVTAGTIAACYTSVAAAETAALAATSASDSCPGTVTKTASTTGTCSATVTVTAYDATGNPASVTYNTRIDNTPPTVTQGTIAACYPSVAAAQAAALAATSATDNCPGTLTETATITGTCTATIVVTTTDNCGNSTPVTYTTRIDGTGPTLTAGAIASCYTSVAAAEAAAIAATTAADGCPGTVAKTATTTGTCPATVIVTATDQCGNTAQRSFTTTIDTTPPTVSAGTIAACYPTAAAAQAAAIAATSATDNCGGTVTKTATTSGTCSAVVTVTAADACGNSATATYNTRIDNTPPTITQGAIAACFPSLSAAQAAAQAATTATDNCPGSVTMSVSTSGSCPATITVTATDMCGNSASTSYTVRVDNTPPVVSCKNATVTLNSSGTYTLTPNDIINQSATSDNCGTYNVAISPNTFNCANRNQTIPVTVTVTDVCGNSSSCIAQITVLETTTLPAPWVGANVGAAAMGSSSYQPCSDFGSFVLSSKGYSTNIQDVQHTVYQSLCGNSEIKLRVTSLNPLAGWAGIQIRESSAQGSRKFTLKTQLSTIVRREARANNFGPTNTLQIGVLVEHSWLRITRNGNTFSAFTSPDGVNWTLRNTATFFMNSCVQVGMFVESYNNLATTTAVFDNVSITGSFFPLVGPSDNGNVLLSPKINIFPNPTSGELVLDMAELTGKTARIQVFNAQGQQVATMKIDEARELERIDLSPYSEGVYWIRVEAEGMTPATEKIYKSNTMVIRP